MHAKKNYKKKFQKKKIIWIKNKYFRLERALGLNTFFVSPIWVSRQKSSSVERIRCFTELFRICFQFGNCKSLPLAETEMRVCLWQNFLNKIISWRSPLSGILLTGIFWPLKKFPGGAPREGVIIDHDVAISKILLTTRLFVTVILSISRKITELF